MKVSQVKSSTPISDLEAFDMMSRFLAAEKAKQLSLDFAGQSYLASSSQIWNDLRVACNSLLEENDPRRDPVAEWKDDAVFAVTSTPKSTPSTKEEEEESTKEEEERRSAKREKKEAKKARKEAKKAKKEAKKARKESKKRKREEESS